MHQSLPSASDAPYFVPALPLGTAALHYLPLIYWLSEAQRPRTILHVGPYDPELERAVMEFVQSSSIDSAWRGVAPNDFSPSPGSLVLWSLNDHRDDSPVDVSLLSAVPDVVVLYFSSAASRFGSSTSLEAVTFDSPSWPCTVFALHDGAPHPVVDKLRSEREIAMPFFGSLGERLALRQELEGTRARFAASPQGPGGVGSPSGLLRERLALHISDAERIAGRVSSEVKRRLWLRTMPSEEAEALPLFNTGVDRDEQLRGLAERALAIDQDLSPSQARDIAVIALSGAFDSEYYLASNTDLTTASIDPLVHYVKHGASEGREPHPLFSTAYYRLQLDENFELINPLSHCVRSFGPEAKSPHPLFDPAYYRASDQSIDELSVSPWLHFVTIGGNAGLSPHPLFDAAYYLRENPDVRATGLNPLIHYIRSGSYEGRKPNSWFDPYTYRTKYSDVITAGFEPLIHYVLHGAQEGRSPKERGIGKYSEFLPLDAPPPLECPPVAVDVVIPVYRDLEATKRCLQSVLDAQNRCDIRVVVINDCSPDDRLTEYLRRCQQRHRFELIENKQNLGFVASVNIGMTLSKDRDVVLLNSDTEVPDQWLDRLASQAYASGSIGSVNPFSNNATLCNFPSPLGFTELDEGGVKLIQSACAVANSGRHVEIPTSVGFCMYIKRRCIEDVGLFDAEAFGKGYGEENDFCMRASARGWKHILAADVFVYHQGERSFGNTAAARKREAAEVLLKRHPSYDLECRRWFSEDPAKPLRIAANSVRHRMAGTPVRLIVEHGLGGGVKRRIDDIIAETPEVLHLLLRRCRYHRDEFDLELVSADPREGVHLVLRSSTDAPFLFDLLRSFGVERILIHHLMDFPLDAAALVTALGVPYDVAVHDYYFACPQVLMVDESGQYCGEPDAVGCGKCLARRPRAGAADILWWRMKHQWLLDHAERVIAPSADCRDRYLRYFPYARVECEPHERALYAPELTRVVLPKDSPAMELRIALLGVLAPHKGAAVVREVMRYIAEHKLPIKLKLIGFIEEGMAEFPADLIPQTGRYDESRLQEHIEAFDPHLIWFTSVCAETYSYTLSGAFKSARPILAPDIGSFPERLNGRKWAWLYPSTASTTEIVRLFQSIAHAVATNTYHEAEDRELPSVTAGRSVLWSTVQIRRVASASPRIKVLVIPEMFNGCPSPCAYIRLLLPLAECARRVGVEVKLASAQEVLTASGDVIVTHRTAVSSEHQIEMLLEARERRGIPLVYDLDDNLMAVPLAHADSKPLADKCAGVMRLLQVADSVWVSTQNLRQAVCNFNDKVSILPNCLDQQIWFDGTVGSRPGAWRDDVVKILYMGTRTHDGDFDLVRAPFRRLYRKLSHAFHLQIIGAINRRYAENWYHFIDPPAGNSSYPSFVRWLRAYNDFHIGIAPLTDSEFNRSKSGIKVLDYSALGLVSIHSDVESYRTLDGEALGSLRVGASPEEWYDALEYLILDGEERNIRRWQAYAHVAHEHTLASAWTAWWRALSAVMRLETFSDGAANEETHQGVSLV